MKAHSLTLTVPYYGCDKICPYCISKITGYTEKNLSMIHRNLPKVKKFAEMSQVSSVVISSKGEPLLCSHSLEWVHLFLRSFHEFPLELQSNGNKFIFDSSEAKDLQEKGLDVLAVSVDDFFRLGVYKAVIKSVPELTWRATVNLTPSVISHSPEEVLESALEAGFNQLSIRQLSYPSSAKKSIHTDYIDGISVEEVYNFVSKFYLLAKEGQLIRQLPYGAQVYDYKGMGITYFPYCVQETSTDTDIRSLIFEEDGHLYTSWSSKASRLF
jgi:MoaA/NifB/PqqE/SkfB family radical SAM enzyme